MPQIGPINIELPATITARRILLDLSDLSNPPLRSIKSATQSSIHASFLIRNRTAVLRFKTWYGTVYGTVGASLRLLTVVRTVGRAVWRHLKHSMERGSYDEENDTKLAEALRARVKDAMDGVHANMTSWMSETLSALDAGISPLQTMRCLFGALFSHEMFLNPESLCGGQCTQLMLDYELIRQIESPQAVRDRDKRSMRVLFQHKEFSESDQRRITQLIDAYSASVQQLCPEIDHVKPMNNVR
ncbi:hypothetical protein BU23DRAFT_660200 [Bimuria novae-zelandiae CBS 107.79]|uniref:Uncharacterized protein n=1 Tax=Bimuria novae-zelandiae CBS 107.79 TaxID=1447943 RepID=A0A6A5VJ20_9PLEO|nr:hypothetical protein BU23DRAFT_660200 [Bimuria novae-zelandiae CBS 107.79]